MMFRQAAAVRQIPATERLAAAESSRAAYSANFSKRRAASPLRYVTAMHQRPAMMVAIPVAQAGGY